MTTRQELEEEAARLGCFDDLEDKTEWQLRGAIAAERAAIAWMARYEALPDDDAKRAAIRRLSESFDKMAKERTTQTEGTQP